MTLIALKTLYEQDYNLWLRTTVHLLRENQIDDIDYDNLIEALESLERSDKRALKSNLEQLIMHLLKWKYQWNKRTGSWERSIKEHRNRILDILEASPSLKPYLNEILNKCYQNAKDYAASETGLSLATFPDIYTFTIQQILELGFLTDI